MNSILDAFLQDDAFARSYRHEELIVDVTESIYKIMRQKDMNKSDLAKATGLSKARITKLLDGSANMTLKSISDIAFALGVTPKVFVDDAVLQAEEKLKDSTLVQSAVLNALSLEQAAVTLNSLKSDIIRELNLIDCSEDRADRDEVQKLQEVMDGEGNDSSGQ